MLEQAQEDKAHHLALPSPDGVSLAQQVNEAASTLMKKAKSSIKRGKKADPAPGQVASTNTDENG